MRAVGAAALAGCLLVPVDAAAHRVDEFLQATRLSLTRDRLVIEMDLTPGTMLAADLIAALDADGDRTISPAEAETYGRAVLGDLIVSVDSMRAAPRLTRIEVPPLDELRDGSGAIRISASSGRLDMPAGHVRVCVRNDHRPRESVYLVNALLPHETGFRVLGQTRDSQQREGCVDYDLAPQPAARLAWTIALLGGLPAWMAVRRRTVLSAASKPNPQD